MYCQEVTPEMLLATSDITFPAMMELLKDPNIWIANTGASCDSTGSYIRMVSKKIPHKSDGVSLPDGQ
eukprot:14481216-Ditylum_brightwellii.AAC.1